MFAVYENGLRVSTFVSILVLLEKDPYARAIECISISMRYSLFLREYESLGEIPRIFQRKVDFGIDFDHLKLRYQFMSAAGSFLNEKGKSLAIRGLLGFTFESRKADTKFLDFLIFILLKLNEERIKEARLMRLNITILSLTYMKRNSKGQKLGTDGNRMYLVKKEKLIDKWNE